MHITIKTIYQVKASEIKAKFAISYADCFAAATALKFSASIITGDPELKLPAASSGECSA
ncbi:MAG TPA: hypothetical protein VMW44_00925 [Candidatus Bathyarchaeia archaeon]|nr:hypothetical protein [Candidatus Bathyarchaeia archaeon]